MKYVALFLLCCVWLCVSVKSAAIFDERLNPRRVGDGCYSELYGHVENGAKIYPRGNCLQGTCANGHIVYLLSASVGSKNSFSTMISSSLPKNDSENNSEKSDLENVEDARKLIKELGHKTRTQAQQILAWRRAYKMQELLISRLQKEKCDQLKALSSKLLLFESRLIRKQKDISTMLSMRENVIQKQQRLIESLTNRLIDNGLEIPPSELNELETNLPDFDSLNDSDSAVVMEDIDQDYNIPKFRSGSLDGITVVRSISDAMDPNLKYAARRSNGFLRRPEILETVYSVEEDADNDNAENKSEANKKRDAFATRGKLSANIHTSEEAQMMAKENKSLEEKVCPNWQFNNEPPPEDRNENSELQETKTNSVKTYNRVMSNHRSVTKPKDVKYKRINKAKSKSLEELRGRLKNWVEQGSKITGIALEHSHSYA